MYQIYHTWIHPLQHSPLSSLHSFLAMRPPTGLIFHLHTCVHSICPIFTLMRLFPTSSSLPLVPNPVGICSALVFSDFVKEKWMTFLLVWDSYREFPSGTSIYTCIIAQSGSSPSLFFFLPYSPSFGGFNRFKSSIFIHGPYSPS
jgi:hypothetical protein